MKCIIYRIICISISLIHLFSLNAHTSSLKLKKSNLTTLQSEKLTFPNQLDPSFIHSLDPSELRNIMLNAHKEGFIEMPLTKVDGKNIPAAYQEWKKEKDNSGDKSSKYKQVAGKFLIGKLRNPATNKMEWHFGLAMRKDTGDGSGHIATFSGKQDTEKQRSVELTEKEAELYQLMLENNLAFPSDFEEGLELLGLAADRESLEEGLKLIEHYINTNASLDRIHGRLQTRRAGNPKFLTSFYLSVEDNSFRLMSFKNDKREELEHFEWIPINVLLDSSKELAPSEVENYYRNRLRDKQDKDNSLTTELINQAKLFGNLPLVLQDLREYVFSLAKYDRYTKQKENDTLPAADIISGEDLIQSIDANQIPRDKPQVVQISDDLSQKLLELDEDFMVSLRELAKWLLYTYGSPLPKILMQDYFYHHNIQPYSDLYQEPLRQAKEADTWLGLLSKKNAQYKNPANPLFLEIDDQKKPVHARALSEAIKYATFGNKQFKTSLTDEIPNLSAFQLFENDLMDDYFASSFYMPIISIAEVWAYWSSKLVNENDYPENLFSAWTKSQNTSKQQALEDHISFIESKIKSKNWNSKENIQIILSRFEKGEESAIKQFGPDFRENPIFQTLLKIDFYRRDVLQKDYGNDPETLLKEIHQMFPSGSYGLIERIMLEPKRLRQNGTSFEDMPASLFFLGSPYNSSENISQEAYIQQIQKAAQTIYELNGEAIILSFLKEDGTPFLSKQDLYNLNNPRKTAYDKEVKVLTILAFLSLLPESEKKAKLVSKMYNVIRKEKTHLPNQPLKAA